MSDLISNSIVALRAMEPTDLDLLYKWENDTRLWTVSNTIAPYSRETLWKYLQSSGDDFYTTRQLRLMVTHVGTRETIGTVDLMNFNPVCSRAELGLFIAPSHQHQGFGAAAIDVVKNYARNGIGLRQVYVLIPVDNTRCTSLFDQSGFQRCGILKSWMRQGHAYQDVVVMQYLF